MVAVTGAWKNLESIALWQRRGHCICPCHKEGHEWAFMEAARATRIKQGIVFVPVIRRAMNGMGINGSSKGHEKQTGMSLRMYPTSSIWVTDKWRLRIRVIRLILTMLETKCISLQIAQLNQIHSTYMDVRLPFWPLI